MASESNADRTYPHDFRLVCTGREMPTVVGGQAVNLWAIAYLDRDNPRRDLSKYSSRDLDILADKKVLDYLKTVPGWIFRPNVTRDWRDSRLGFLYGTREDGRKLVVEVLHDVYGLDKSDLAHVETLGRPGHQYRLLDPIVMLKAKAANVRDLAQDGDPPRQDRQHLKYLAQCLPLYLSEVHQRAVKDPNLEKESLGVISRAFKTLQHAKTAYTLVAEGIKPVSLIPADLAESPLPRIRTAHDWQFRQLAGAAESDVRDRPSVATRLDDRGQTPRQGPRMGI